MPRILIVGDNRAPFPDLTSHLRRAGHEVDIAGNTEVMWTILLARPADAIVLELPANSSLYIVPLLREHFPDTALLTLRTAGPRHFSVLSLESGSFDRHDKHEGSPA